MNQSGFQITLLIVATKPPSEARQNEIKEIGARLVATKLQMLGVDPRSLIVRTATITPASPEIQIRYPMRDIWRFEISLEVGESFWALVCFNSSGVHFFEYPITAKDTAKTLF